MRTSERRTATPAACPQNAPTSPGHGCSGRSSRPRCGCAAKPAAARRCSSWPSSIRCSRAARSAPSPSGSASRRPTPRWATPPTPPASARCCGSTSRTSSRARRRSAGANPSRGPSQGPGPGRTPARSQARPAGAARRRPPSANEPPLRAGGRPFSPEARYPPGAPADMIRRASVRSRRESGRRRRRRAGPAVREPATLSPRRDRGPGGGARRGCR